MLCLRTSKTPTNHRPHRHHQPRRIDACGFMIRRTTFSVTGFIIPMYYTHSPLFRFASGPRARCTYWLNMFSSVFEFAAFDTGFGIAEESWCSYYNFQTLLRGDINS